MKKRMLCALIVSATLACTAAMSQPPEINLPGHSKEEGKVLNSRTAVAVVTLISEGPADAGPPATIEYRHSKLRVNEPLLGDPKKEISTFFYCVDYPTSEAESLPVRGTQYIAFLRTTKRRLGEAEYDVLKLSVYNPEELEKVKKLIKELPQPAK